MYWNFPDLFSLTIQDGDVALPACPGRVLGYLEGDHFGICDCLGIPRAIQPGWIDKAVTILDIEEIVRHQFLRRAKFLSPIGSSACAYPLVTVRLCIVRSNLEATMTAVKKTA